MSSSTASPLPRTAWVVWLYLHTRAFFAWFACNVCINALPDRMKRAFVLASLHARIKKVYQSQDMETFARLNKLFSLTDGVVCLELPTRYFSRQIWQDEEIAMIRVALDQQDPDLHDLSSALVLSLPKWVRYSGGKSLPAMEVEQLLKLQTSAKL
jgi:hypothetical protein